MLPFEILVVGYFAFFALAAPVTRVAGPRRVGAAIAAASIGGAVAVAARVCPLDLRLSLPLLYIPLGYWIPVLLVPRAESGAFEAWLRHTDAAARSWLPRVPRWLASVLELAYLACFPLVPIALGVVWAAGSSGDVVRYWFAVLAAGYACYMTLPWLVSRPPRFVEGRDAACSGAARGPARVNHMLLARVSHGLNTFPSGHVAVAVAAAIAVARIWPAAGAVLAVVAAAIAAGAVAGRYHYIPDVAAGVAVGAITAYASSSAT